MNTLRHEMIFASAGSGKTFALTTRYIRLLALGVAPERIVALTFTRKAAGEFFGEILNRLAGAGGDEKKARLLAGAVGRPELTPVAFRGLLRGMVGAMHRLNLGTLDGFFAKIVRAFPLELGLGGEPGLLDEHSATEEMRRVLAQLFAARGGLTPEQRDLLEAFRLATFGKEEKNVAEQFDGFVRDHLALWRAASQPAKWGIAGRIWPEGFPWGGIADDAATARAAEELLEWATHAGLADKHRERLTDFARAALEWAPGEPWSPEISYVAQKVLAVWPRFAAGGAELKFDRKVLALSRDAAGALATLVRRLVGLELGRRMAVTQGIAAVMRTFDALYDAEVRRAGRLTFADLQQLLSPERLAGSGREGGVLAGGEFAYRLDARMDHWLFDEFQDTSYQQWKILERLVDEVVEDGEGRRSLFYVGDVKQAIFTWREGDPRLFAHVAERYRSAAGGGIVAGELSDSWRSGPELIEMVNRVCGDAAALAELFPEAAAEWKRHWRDHRSARPENRGQAALLLADDEAGRWATVLRLLQEIRPTERGLTCAVLVRKNEVGAHLAEYLRREGGIAAVAESDLKIGTDNPVAAALAALLQVSAHPEDACARRLVAMSPLAALPGAELGDRCTEEVVTGRSVLGEVEANGFEAWLAAWARRLESVLPAGDAFTRLRLRQLTAAGRVFDETGRRDVDGFLRFLGEYTVREPEGAGVVRVMTVHKSKGLGFDVVILPDLEGQTLVQRREGPAVRKTAERAVDWVLAYPGAVIAESDPVLGAYQAEALAENCYEQLSLLYVALTRAKRAMYVVIERPGKTASRNYPKLLTATLGAAERMIGVGAATLVGVWSAGAADWFAGIGAGAAVGGSTVPNAGGGLGLLEDAPIPHGATKRAALVARRPSGLKPARVAAERLFAEGQERSADFGTKVHALLAGVEWADSPEPARGVGRTGHRKGAAGDAWEEAEREAQRCLRSEGLRAVFAKENECDEVWRECAFEAVIGEAWVSGVLDRVVVRRLAGGGASAAVFDFKTERGATERGLQDRHAPQLEVYREVVARLTGVEQQAVRAFVVATELGQLVEIACPAR